MNLDFLLSPQVVASIIILAMLILSIRSVLLYTRNAAALRPRLLHLDRELRKRHEGAAEKRKAVEALTRQLAPLRAQETALRDYYEELRELEREEEKKDLAKHQEEEAERRLRITRRKMGL